MWRMKGWHEAANRYARFLEARKNLRVLFLELGAGYNTPGIIKFSFWKMVKQWKTAVYVCVNQGEAFAPEDVKEKSICINDDIGRVLYSI